MVQDLMECEVQDILLNTFTKKPYLVLKRETKTVNRVTLFDIANQKEIQYQIDAPNQLVVDRSMQLILPEFYFNKNNTQSEFKKIERDFAEQYLLTQQQLDTIIGLLQQLNALPRDIFVERKSPEAGTKTTENTATKLITETGHSKYIKDAPSN